MADKILQGSESVMKALNEIIKRMGGGSVEVGFIDNAVYPDGTPVAAVAFWNEYGKLGQPARPFFRQMIEKESGTWVGKIAKLAVATNYNGEQVLREMGEDIKGALQQSINEFQTPVLAASTIAAKEFSKPLIDTSDMLNAITYKVE